MGRRFVDAWHRAERGEIVDETNITFRDLETLLAALTPKRLHLLRYVRHHEVRNVRALAAGLRRNYKNVHKDVEELTKLGLAYPALQNKSSLPMPRLMPALCFIDPHADVLIVLAKQRIVFASARMMHAPRALPNCTSRSL